jgi:hypothetical protein
MWGAVVIIATAVSTISATSVAASPTSSDSKDDQRKKRNEWTYTFPVSGPEVFYPRDHLDYPAADLSGCRQLVRAPISGVVVDVRDTDNWDPAVDSPGTRGGLTITLHGDDFVRYYFSHLGRLMVKKGWSRDKRSPPLVNRATPKPRCVTCTLECRESARCRSRTYDVERFGRSHTSTTGGVVSTRRRIVKYNGSLARTRRPVCLPLQHSDAVATAEDYCLVGYG